MRKNGRVLFLFSFIFDFYRRLLFDVCVIIINFDFQPFVAEADALSV